MNGCGVGICATPVHCDVVGYCAERSPHRPTVPRVVLVEPPTNPLIEPLRWHDVAAGDMPDPDLTVLLWTDDAEQPWAAGWFDGEVWRLCESGGECAERVLFWSSPEGPI